MCVYDALGFFLLHDEWVESHCGGDTDNKLLLNVSHCFQSLDPLRGSTFLVLFTDIFLTIFSHHWQLCTSRFINLLFCLRTVYPVLIEQSKMSCQEYYQGYQSVRKRLAGGWVMKIRGKTIDICILQSNKNIVHFFLSPPTPTHRQSCSFVQLTTVRRCHKQRKGNTTIFGKRLR